MASRDYTEDLLEWLPTTALVLAMVLFLNAVGILLLQALLAPRARREPAFDYRRGGALVRWTVGGAFAGFLAGYAAGIPAFLREESHRRDEIFGSDPAYGALLGGACFAAAVAAILAGAACSWRRARAAARRYLGGLFLAAGAVAASWFAIRGFWGLILLFLTILFSPLLASLLAAWAIRREGSRPRRDPPSG